MSAESEYLTIDRAKELWTVRLKPTDCMMFGRPEATEPLFELLDEVRARHVKVLRCDYPSGSLSPTVVDRFWDEAKHAPLVAVGRHEPPVPAIVRNATTAIPRLIKELRRSTTLCITSFKGEVDFDLLDLLLVGHYRICSEDTVIVNRVLDRDAVPASATLWLLTHYLGVATATHLVLEGKSLTAQEALDMRLVNRVVAPADLEAEAEAIAQEYVAKPARALSSYVHASRHLDADLTTYLEQTGSNVGL